MAQRSDNIPVGRPRKGRQLSQEPEEPQLGGVAAPDVDTVRRTKIIAILMGVFAILVLIALLSFTSKDEANAQLTMKEMMGVIRGDEALRARFETTHNWLGLLGAVLSHWMYTSTVGIWSIAIPVLMLFWSFDLYRFQRITPRIKKYTVASIVTSVVVAGVFGTFQLVSWMPDIDRILCGSIGQFVAGTISQFIGTAGSTLVLLVALGFVLVLGFDVRPTYVQVFLQRTTAQLKDLVARRSSTARTDHTDEEAEGEEDASEEFEDEEEPAVAPVSGRPRILPRGNIIRPRSQPVEDDADEEPAEMLRRGQSLSSTVRIVRATPGKGEPPKPVERASREPEADAPSRVDLDDLQKRLQELHPNKDIAVKGGVKGPSDPGDAPELPLFLAEDEEDDTPVTLPVGVPARPLTISVEQPEEAEVEVPLVSATLYDEQIAYKPPPISLLDDSKDAVAVDDDELRENARILQEKLETFRIKIENLTVQPGPVVTQYEFVPASGIKVSQIESLADDIALALKAPAVRIIAPIPGKGTVGIEIPNHNPSIVRFGSVIKSPKYQNPDIKLPIAMGKTVVGEVFCADLTKMPHLLIAGATGKGKSVGINTIIASLLYRMHPRDLKFVIIDPKRVEMTLYRSLKNHFLAISPDIDETIITEPQNAVAVLKSVVEEMQMRYNVLAAAGQRNIQEYNRKVKEGKIKDQGGFQHRPMPYIVVVIDELADLMMTASKEVEEPIVRIAQLARAVGIHCIVATQRPSVDVVTGLIKANFPARIAYQVSARVDSRTILDGSGAEHLIGNGDMLFAPGNTTKPLRMQNAFISTEEVEAICEHIGKQRGYSQPYMLPSIAKNRGGVGGGIDDDRDALFEDAARIFIQLQQASVSTLQRRLKVGYARAARIVDELESAGIVGPPDGSKGRAVLLQSESELEAYL